MKLQKYYETAGIPKGEPRKRTKGRKDRAEAKILHMVRMHDVARDGFCRVVKDHFAANGIVVFAESDWMCEGESQLMHLGDKKRFKTRGMKSEERHQTAFTAMGCAKHHDMVDGRRFPRLEPHFLSPEGANGEMTWRLV